MQNRDKEAGGKRKCQLPLQKTGRDIRKISGVLIAVYVLMLIPLLIIGRYDYPSADDYTMGLGTRLIYEETGSVAAVLQKVLSETARYYRTWIGYFTSCLFTTVNPATFGEGWYGLTPVIMLAGLHAGVILLLYVLMERILGMNRYVRRCMTVLVLFLMVQRMPEGGLRTEAFYWYSGAGNYTLTFSLGLLYWSSYLSGISAGGTGRRRAFLFLASVLGFLAGGGNYLSALFHAILSACGCLWMVQVKQKEDRRGVGKEDGKGKLLAQMLPAVCLLAGLAVNCLAPGNQIRGAATEGYGAVKAILLSLYYTLSYPLNQWMNWSVLLILLLAAVFFWRDFSKAGIGRGREGGHSDQGSSVGREVLPCADFLHFDHPLLASVYAYGLVSAVITPALFAQGNIGAGRIQSTFWLHFVLVLLLLEWYLVGCLHRSLSGTLFYQDLPQGADDAASRRDEREESLAKRPDAAGVLGVLFLVFSVLTVKGNPYFYSFSSALEDLTNGTAGAYGEENAARSEILTDGQKKDVVLARYHAKPELLYYMDISEDPEDWVNQKLCLYYHKDSVRGAADAQK